MSENEKPQEGEQAPQYLDAERFKNYQAEVARKLENTNAQLNQVLEALKTKATPAPQAGEPTKKVSVFEDEEAYGQRIAAEAEARIEAKLSRQQAEQAKQAAVIQKIYSEFPEVQDESGPLMQRAREIYNGLSAEEKISPVAMKAAVTEAAAELGVKPKSKRSSDDNFQLGGSSGQRERRGAAKENQISDEMLEFAARLGQNVDDPKYIERLKKAAGRKNWRNYE